MGERYWTPAEVEGMIPRLAHVMDALMPAHREATQRRERLESERQRVALAGGGLVDQAAWRADTERITSLTKVVQQGIEEITKLGGVIKDLGLGLVDFPHRREGRVVHLCWKHGEDRIRYWHGLDEGYAARKPL
jgi:hypothetical protein